MPAKEIATMTAYHATTPRKLSRYHRTGAILPPVRWWSTEVEARRWMRRTGRSVLVVFTEPARAWPLPVRRGARWSDQMVRTFAVVRPTPLPGDANA